MIKTKLIFSALFCFLFFGAGAQHIFQINEKLGQGVNMGNMFEAPSEAEWGNPYRDDYFPKIAGLGFNHVRIPTRWDTPDRALQSEPYTINPYFLLRMKKVVDDALAVNLYVILNMHHHEEIFLNPEAVKPRFLSQWQQIASYFKNYDDRLLFEVMNEPHDKLTPDLWNVFFADALKEIRKTNPTRVVLMGMANYGGLSGAPFLKPPDDPNIILSVHYYDPFNFTHQGAEWVEGANAWLGTTWDNNNLQQKDIINQFQFLESLAGELHLPIHVGEFGAYSKADFTSRILWTSFLARWFESKNWSWAYWEFSAGFGFFDPITNVFNNDLVNALLKNPLPEAKIVETSKIYQSNFSIGKDNWNLYLQGGAVAVFNVKDNQATVEISKKGTEGWHVQFVHNDFTIKKGKRYLISFQSSADKNTNITCYVGKASDPYNSYSGYRSVSPSRFLSETLYTFEMTSDTDTKARFVFDMGFAEATNIILSDLKIEEIVDDNQEPELILSDYELPEITIYPNPTSDFINISNLTAIQNLEIFNTNGKKEMSFDFATTKETNINLGNLAPGIHFIKIVTKNEQTFSRKLMVN